MAAFAQHIDARADGDDGVLNLDLGGVTFMDSTGAEPAPAFGAHPA